MTPFQFGRLVKQAFGPDWNMRLQNGRAAVTKLLGDKKNPGVMLPPQPAVIKKTNQQ